MEGTGVWTFKSRKLFKIVKMKGWAVFKNQVYITIMWPYGSTNSKYNRQIFITEKEMPVLSLSSSYPSFQNNTNVTHHWSSCHQIGNSFIFYRPQRSWAKVIFSQASVCPQGGSASVHAGMHSLGPDPPGNRPPPEQTHLPPGGRLQHTVNERPVRILLECILVVNSLV